MEVAGVVVAGAVSPTESATVLVDAASPVVAGLVDGIVVGARGCS